MEIARFAETSFSLNAFRRAARDVPGGGTRLLTIPHPSYVVHSTAALENEFPSSAHHVGWQSLLIAEEEPQALFEAAPDPMGRLSVVSTTRGNLPRAIVDALAIAEQKDLIGENEAFAIVSVPQVGLTAVWLPRPDVVISVGPDVHAQMPLGSPTQGAALTSIVREIFQHDSF